MLYGATVVVSPSKITYTLHHCQLSDTSTLINLHQRIFERETDRQADSDRQRGTERELCNIFKLKKISYKINSKIEVRLSN